jgi:hypothetical protein
MRRKKQDETVGGIDAGDTDTAATDEQKDPRAEGPWDASEVQLDEDDATRVDLGALSVKGRPGVEVRLQADEASGQVQAVMVVAEDGAMELRAFASPRNESIWDDIRARLASEATKRGGQAGEVEGPYGTALQMVLPAKAPDGTEGTQTSTVLGITGPRWLLRVSTFGRPAVEYHSHGVLEQVLRDVVVNRGNEPMSPGDPLTLTMPANARRRIPVPPQQSDAQTEGS